MAKGNMLLGRARKSAGSLTFRVSDGEQIISAKATSVKNPKTVAQQLQRAIFATVSQMTTALYPVVNHSFEGQSRTNGSLRAFRRTALNEIRNIWNNGGAVCLNAKGNTDPMPNAVTISKGSLGSLESDFDILPNRNIAYIGSIVNEQKPDNLTLQHLSQYIGIPLQPGDEIAFTGIYLNGENTYAVFARVVFFSSIPSDAIVFDSTEYSDYMGFNPEYLVTDKCQFDSRMLLQIDELTPGHMRLGINYFADLIGIAAHVSRYDTQRGKWLFTTSKMELKLSFFQTVDNSYNIGTYGMSAGSVPDSDYYLEQSSTEDVAVTESTNAINVTIADDDNLNEATQDGLEGTIQIDATSANANVAINIKAERKIYGVSALIAGNTIDGINVVRVSNNEVNVFFPLTGITLPTSVALRVRTTETTNIEDYQLTTIEIAAPVQP